MNVHIVSRAGIISSVQLPGCFKIVLYLLVCWSKADSFPWHTGDNDFQRMEFLCQIIYKLLVAYTGEVTVIVAENAGS